MKYVHSFQSAISVTLRLMILRTGFDKEFFEGQRKKN
jgi:hypothetical protein